MLPVPGRGPDLTLPRCCCRRATLLSMWERKDVQGECSLDPSVVAWYTKNKSPPPPRKQLPGALLQREGEH